MDVYEEEFRGVIVTGGEGWSAQMGEASLNSTVNGDDGDEADSVDVVEKQTQAQTQTQTQAQTQTQTQAGSSKSTKRRTGKDMAVAAVERRSDILDMKNRIAEKMLESEKEYSVKSVIQMLNGLPGVRMWSPFYKAAVEHLVADEASRQAFVAYPRDEDKIEYLELRTRRFLSDY